MKTKMNKEFTPQVAQANEISEVVPLSQLEDFWYEMCEDWHLWDVREQGPYPVQRTFDAMKKFINYHKSK
jgi:hypothetical protein